MSRETVLIERVMGLLNKMADNELKMVNMIKELSERIKQLERRL